MKHQAYLLLGSNLGNRYTYLQSAAAEIASRCGQIVHSSTIYESSPWGFDANQKFLNQALHIETTLSPEILLHKLLLIEKKLGRTRNTNGYASREIDIDILYFDNITFKNEQLSIPHPRLHLRRFVLMPLVEIASDYIHPILHISNLDLLANSNDNSDVRPLNLTH